MPVEIQFVFFDLLFNIRNQVEPLCKSAFHEMLVQLGGYQVNESLNEVVLVALNHRCFDEFFKHLDRLVEFLVIPEIEMCTHEVVHALDIMSSLYFDHFGIVIENVYPFLAITVIHQKILGNEGIPAVTLIKIESLIKDIAGQAMLQYKLL